MSKRIPNLQYRHGDNKCSIGAVGGRKIFAWVNSHSNRVCRLNVWFLGDLEQARRFSGLRISARKTEAKGSWAEYQGSFSIENETQLSQAVELLISVSYPASV